MNSSNLLLKMLGRVFVKSDDIHTSRFVKTGHTIDSDGSERIIVEYIYRRKSASPVAPSKKNTEPQRKRMFDELVRAKIKSAGAGK